MAISTIEKTERGLFIIESLKRTDEESRREGVIIQQILTLSESLPVKYIYIRTEPELSMALEEFKRSNYRYLHISCHGSKDSISLTLDPLPFEDLVPIITPYLKARRLFFSACSVVNPLLANLLMKQAGCYSIIGPCRKINFDDALLMWASFYHLAFRDEEESKLLGGKIRWALRRVKYSFGEEFHYYRKAKGGWRQEDIERR
jgi:hypothetical protein